MLTARRMRSRPEWPALVVGLLLALLPMSACTTDAEAPEGQELRQVTLSDRVYTIEDLFPMGFKKNKQYDVEGLPHGVDAWSGFWGLDPFDRSDYEIRFYASHEDAVDYGTPLAEEVTGEDAELHRDDPTWKEGAKDRWRSSSVVGLTRGLQSGRLGRRYLGFVIFANMAILSEGEDRADALEKCRLLVDALRSTDAP